MLDLICIEKEVVKLEDLIQLRNLRKIYKMGDEKIIALNNIDLDIGKKEFVCLIGTSGSGKST